MRPKLPDPYVPDTYAQTFILSNGGIASGAWPVNNKAIYVPIIFPYPCQLYSLTFAANNGTGNYDLGFYDGYSKVRIQSTGSTAMTAAGAKTMTFTVDCRVDPGKLYYAALALSSTSGLVVRTSGNSIQAGIMLGAGEQTTALPLPNPMVPVTLSSATLPLFTFGIR